MAVSIYVNLQCNHDTLERDQRISQYMWPIARRLYVWLTHWGLVTPYCDRDLTQHWLRQWLVAWRHQAITWTNVDLSPVEFCAIHLTTILLVSLMVSIHGINSKIIFFKLQPHLPGANEVRMAYVFQNKLPPPITVCFRSTTAYTLDSRMHIWVVLCKGNRVWVTNDNTIFDNMYGYHEDLG